MSRAARIGLIIVGFLLVVVVIAGIGLTVVARRPFPKTDGTITVPGLSEEVTVYRDDFGIPHIYANNDADLFFAQGYVHAQDRFWQMEFWRHIGQGRIAEITGEPGVNSDKFIRTVGWPRYAAQTVAYYQEEEPEYYALLEAYSAGVNAYIEQNRGALALQITILGAVNEPWEIEPWTPLHTIAWGVVMSDDLGGNWRSERSRVELLQTIGEADLELLWPPYPYDSRPVIAPTDAQVNEVNETAGVAGETAVDWQRVNTSLVAEPPANGFIFGHGLGIGSNDWVVSGEHTASGLPLLADDPHLGVQMPSIWYEVGLHAPGWDVVGFSFAGVPGVIIGHNDKIAWGVTNVGPDVQDLFIEKINPSDPTQYEFMGEWRDMEILEEVIHVNGGADVTLEVRLTQHGPILNDVVDGLSDVLAFRWSAQEPSRVLQSVVMLNQAQNYEDFRAALRYWDGPSQNFVYADVEGNIAYQVPGLIPIRQNGDGTVPVPGWTGEYEWIGWIPYEELPALLNPEWGYIATANHAVVDPDYPHFLGRDWADGDRGQRIVDMLEEAIAAGDVTADDIARIQFDSLSLPAATYVPLLDGLSSDDARVQAAIERLRGWDLQERRDSVPAALFEIFYWQLAENVLADNVGAENANRLGGNIFMHTLAEQPNARWWDDIGTAEKETREDILLRALADAVDWLDENVGSDMNDWTWGTIHTVTFRDGVLGQSGISLIESIFNRGPFPVDGGNSIVNAASWSRGNPAEMGSGVSMRMIVDMADLEASRTIHPTGQSGHAFHPHYDDMIDLWRNGEYHPMRFGREAVEAAAVDTLVLQPGE
ncbi:MAG: penicillin acylase family protein [Anaerolineales bacterium]|nr:penicillin acylase family protein [Anaerolineales bacterium]